jgi:Siphovirus ReqiPepy6 Gp37-like protein
MIHCLVFDNQLNQKDIIQYTDAKFSNHIFNTQQFSLKVKSGTKINPEDIITLIENRKPIFSGVVIGQKLSGINEMELSGYNLKFILEGIMHFDLFGFNPVAIQSIQSTNITEIQNQIAAVFPMTNIISDTSMAETSNFSIDVRLKSIGQLLRDISVTTDCIYDFFVIGNKTIKLVIKSIRDLRNQITLLTNITHTEIEKIINVKEKYNQIIGLGSGEGSLRDFHFINNKPPNEHAKCYVYDDREGDMSHEELVRRTENKYKTLLYDYQSKFQVLENKVFKLGEDYDLGDLVTFKSNDGTMFDDLISSLNYEIVNGQLKQNYEITTGLLKGTLIDKIKELQEGGTQ